MTETIKKQNKTITEKSEPRKNIAELFADYNGDYIPTEIDFGKPVGKEIW